MYHLLSHNTLTITVLKYVTHWQCLSINKIYIKFISKLLTVCPHRYLWMWMESKQWCYFETPHEKVNWCSVRTMGVSVMLMFTVRHECDSDRWCGGRGGGTGRGVTQWVRASRRTCVCPFRSFAALLQFIFILAAAVSSLATPTPLLLWVRACVGAFFHARSRSWKFA